MPIYVISCAQGHTAEVLVAMSAPLPTCATCGNETRKVPAAPALLGQAAGRLPPAHDRMPQTWKGTYRGNAEYVTGLQRTAQDRTALEDKHPELRGDRRPVLAHEGRYAETPLRAGDSAAPTLPNVSSPAAATPD